MVKMIWHNFWVNYYMHFYNGCNSQQQQKRGELIKRASYHQSQLLNIKLAKHNSKPFKNRNRAIIE
ncbi:hypothetical protein CR194_13040 [Salipaludibacillus keqinensis]|uniref:Uncharacterized protein n=1 Tax=Salipaludibacillus keqinensis TaxID=2045207 RepID=A0A323TCQ7_9BACI|nr:hypothetical protein CR194_13040 [Salipaludibacillus keqinensis]